MHDDRHRPTVFAAFAVHRDLEALLPCALGQARDLFLAAVEAFLAVARLEDESLKIAAVVEEKSRDLAGETAPAAVLAGPLRVVVVAGVRLLPLAGRRRLDLAGIAAEDGDATADLEHIAFEHGCPAVQRRD